MTMGEMIGCRRHFDCFCWLSFLCVSTCANCTHIPPHSAVLQILCLYTSIYIFIYLHTHVVYIPEYIYSFYICSYWLISVVMLQVARSTGKETEGAQREIDDKAPSSWRRVKHGETAPVVGC